MNIVLFNDYEIDNLNSLNYLIQEKDCEACKYGKCIKDLKLGCYWYCDDKNCYIDHQPHNFIFAGIKK